MRTIFLNNDHRLRSGWRILLQFLSFIVLLIVVQSLRDAAEAQHSVWLLLSSSIVYLLGIGGTMWAFAHWIDRRPLADYGCHICKEWWLDFGVGFLLGAVTLTTVFLIQWKLGWLQITTIGQTVFEGSFILVGAVTLINLLAIAVGEEFTFRGYQIRNLAEGLSSEKRGTWAPLLALITSAIVFGILHMGNPNATWVGGVNVVLAGLLLGWGYLLTGELALPVGLHFAWGYFEEFVYGFANSGQTPTSRLIGSEVIGPDLWTGGEFGPEASILMTMLIVVDALLIVAWIKSRKRWQGVKADLAEYK